MRLPAWHAHPDVWLLFGSAAAFYLIACRRHLRDTGEATPVRRTRLFLLGVAILWVGADWPIHDLAERYLYSVHMAQHILFTLVAAPILIAGTPAWMLRRLLAPRPVMAVFRRITRPLVALVLFDAVLLFTHWPAVVTASVHSEWLHFGLHVMLTGSALIQTMFPVRSLTIARTSRLRLSMASCWVRESRFSINQSGGELTPTHRFGGRSLRYFRSCGAALVSDW